MEEAKSEIVNADNICNRVYVIRGQQVMLDYDLAEIYGYEVKRLNEQVKRNILRFPEDFMFQLTKEEIDLVKSQIATSPNNNFFEGQDGGRRKAPYAFTEQGIYMLATVLRGKLAEQQSIFIMRAFREMRHYIKQNQQFVTQAEMSLVTTKVADISVQVAGIADWKLKTDKEIKDIPKSIDVLSENFVTEKDIKNFVIYKGQKFEADMAYIDIVVNDFVEQYPPLCIKPNPDCHDRWIVIDYGLPTEQVYHCGASSKDAGKKLCAINKMEKTNIIHLLIDELLAGNEVII